MQSMKAIFIKAIYLFVFSAVLVVCAYSWGYLYGKQNGSSVEYERLLVSISSHIFIRDALEVDKIELLRPRALGTIELDFIRMAQLYEKYEFEKFAYLRCAVSRRVRALRKDGQIMTDEETLKKIEFSLDKINHYLEKECLGEPSHTNWVSDT
jgi:hypothetical protein